MLQLCISVDFVSYHCSVMYFIAILSHKPSWAGCIPAGDIKVIDIDWLIAILWPEVLCSLHTDSHILITVMYMCMQLLHVLRMHSLRLAPQHPIYSTSCRLLFCMPYPLVGVAMNFDLTCTRLKVSTSCRTYFYSSPQLIYRSSASTLRTQGDFIQNTST